MKQLACALLFLSLAHAAAARDTRRYNINELPGSMTCTNSPSRNGRSFIALDPADDNDCTVGLGSADPHWCVCDGMSATYKVNSSGAPLSHASQHEDGGSDEVAVTGGMMNADFGDFTCDGTATGCDLDSLAVDIAEINASGAPGGANFLRGDGTWASIGTGANEGAATAAAEVGAAAAEEIDTAGVYEPIPTSWSELVDPETEWSVQSTNYYCYNGTATLTNAIITFDFSVTKTEQAATQTLTFRFGTEQQSTLPMSNGDEFGETYERTITGTDVAGLGSMHTVVTLVQNDCIGIMATTDSSTPTIQFNGGTLLVDTGGEENALESDGATGIESAEVFWGTSTGVGAYAAHSGDFTCTSGGVCTIGSDAVGASKIDSTTGAYDFGGVTSLEIPNSATPTVNAAGELAVDTTITSHDGLIKYYDGTTEMVVIAIPVADLTTTDGHVAAYDTAAVGFTMEAQAGGGGGSMPPIVIRPQQNEPPTSDYATLDLRNVHPVLDFDDATDESAVFTTVLPAEYAGGGLTCDIYWAATTATTLEVEWNMAIEYMDDGTLDIDADSFAAANNVNTTTSGTSGILTKSTITFTDGADMDSWAAGNPGRVKVTRDADNVADDMTGDAELKVVVCNET